MGLALKKKALVEGEAGGGYAGFESRGSAAAAAAGDGRGGLAHLADFKWWIGLVAIGLGTLKHISSLKRSIKSHEYSLSLSY